MDLNSIISSLTPQQLEKLSAIKNPEKLDRNTAMALLKDLNIELKNAPRPLKPRIALNSLCICNSGKKYKKCCFKK